MPRTLLVLASFHLLAPSALAQSNAQHSPPIQVRAGVLTGVHVRHGEVFEGTNGAIGTWVAVGFGLWDIDVDLAVSRQLEFSGDACVDRSCTTTAPGRHLERNSAFGAAALRHIQTDSAASPHFLFGWGAITRRTSYKFDDPALGRLAESTWIGCGPVAGVGVDFVAGRYVTRAQYRWNLRVEDGIHQFRVGAGLRF